MTLQRKTIFIIGAGASKDFGSSMPVGSELAQSIEQQLSDEFRASGVDGPIKYALMSSAGGMSPNDRVAANQIRRSIFAQASIDDLLNEWRDSPNLIKVGKVSIANAILTAERNSSLHATALSDLDTAYDVVSSLRDSWLGLILRRLRLGVSRRNIEEIFQEVGFIVFNYDRCIEQYLFWAFQSVAGISQQEAAAVVDKIPIVHVYGSLGRLPFQPLSGSALSIPFGYEGRIHEGIFNRIRTYTEENHDTESLKKIHALVRGAERIVFLGFGFHQQNMKLLLGGGPISPLCKSWGTAIGASASRLNDVQANFAGHRGAFDDISSSNLLSRFEAEILF